jgi:MoaA/NifB/PqqE/SkfB family radical SAM enzyme
MPGSGVMLNQPLDNFEIFRWNGYKPVSINGKEYQLNNQPYLDIVLTDHCNRACRFCIADLVDKRENCDPVVFEKQIDFAISNYGVQEVLLVGGEPTISKELWAVLDILAVHRDAGRLKKICITTNGDKLKNEKFRRDLFFQVTHVNLSLMHTDTQKQMNIGARKKYIEENDLVGIYKDCKESDTHFRINCNVFRGNNETVGEAVVFYDQVKDYCDSVKFSPLLRVDDFSVVNKAIDFVKANIMDDSEYEDFFKGIELAFSKYPIVRNPLTFGFVEYSMICKDTPIILNYNHRGRMAEFARGGFINNFKLLTNGNLSLSWNKDDEGRVIRKAPQ